MRMFRKYPYDTTHWNYSDIEKAFHYLSQPAVILAGIALIAMMIIIIL